MAPTKVRLFTLVVALVTTALGPLAPASAQSGPRGQVPIAASSASDGGCSSSQQSGSGGPPLGLSFEQDGVEVPLGAPATVGALAVLAPVLKVGTEVSFKVISGPDVNNPSDHGQAEAVTHPHASSLPCIPAADFSFTHDSKAQGKDTVMASVTVNGHTVTNTTTVTWVPPLDCSQPWPSKIGYLNALDCTARTVAGSALAKNIFEGVSCALSVVGFVVPGGDAADVFAHAPEDTAVAKLVIDLKDLQKLGIDSKAFFLELYSAGSIPAFLHDVINFVQTVSAKGGTFSEEVENVASDITDLTGVSSCTDLLEEVLSPPSTPSTPFGQFVWTEQNIPSPGQSFEVGTVSCADGSFCMAVGSRSTAPEELLSATFNGERWEKASILPDSEGDPVGGTLVSCPDPGFCVALLWHEPANQVDVFKNGKWGTPETLEMNAAAALPTVLSCASPTFCMALGLSDGGGAVWVFNGHTWASSTVTGWANIGPSGALDFFPSTISCPTDGFCAVVGGEESAHGGGPVSGYVVDYMGGLWGALQQIDANDAIVTVSCANRQFCAAVDGYHKGMVFNGSNGSTWSSPSEIDSGYCASFEECIGLACPASGFCIVADGGGGTAADLQSGHGQVSVYENGSWSKPNVFEDVLPLTSLSCPTAHFCAALSAADESLIGRAS